MGWIFILNYIYIRLFMFSLVHQNVMFNWTVPVFELLFLGM